METAQIEVSYGDAVKWESSDVSIAEVDKNGKVTTQKAGTAVIPHMTVRATPLGAWWRA